MFEKLRNFCLIPTLNEKIITHEIINRATKENNISLEADELQQALNDWRLENKLDTAEATQLWLQRHYLTLPELGELISTDVLAQKLARHLFKQQAESCFIDYQIDYMQASIHEIILDNEGMAMELYYAINEQEICFFDAAYRQIKDPELRRKCGYQELYRKDLKPEISAAVFAVEPPQILPPITTSTGVHLIRVEEIIKPQLNDAVLQEIISQLFDDWMKLQIEQLNVKIEY